MNHLNESTGGIIIYGVFGVRTEFGTGREKMKMKRTFGIRLNDILKNCSERIILILFFTVFRCDEIGVF